MRNAHAAVQFDVAVVVVVAAVSFNSNSNAEVFISRRDTQIQLNGCVYVCVLWVLSVVAILLCVLICAALSHCYTCNDNT